MTIKRGFGLVSNKVDHAPEQVDNRCAVLLAKALRESQRRGRPQWKKYAQSFVNHRKKHDIPAERFERVINWLVDNLQDKYTPRVTNGNDVCVKFQQIEEQIARTEEKKERNKPTIKVSNASYEAAAKIANKVGVMWPEVAKHEEVEMIARTIEFMQRVWDIVSRERNTNGPVRIAFECLWHQLLPPAVFAEDWLHETNHIVSRLDNWNGHLLGWEASLRSKRFRRYFDELLSHYMTAEQVWERISQGISDEKESH